MSNTTVEVKDTILDVSRVEKAISTLSVPATPFTFVAAVTLTPNQCAEAATAKGLIVSCGGQVNPATLPTGTQLVGALNLRENGDVAVIKFTNIGAFTMTLTNGSGSPITANTNVIPHSLLTITVSRTSATVVAVTRLISYL